MSGWLYARPGFVIGLIWGIAYFIMVPWIMRDVEADQQQTKKKDKGATC